MEKRSPVVEEESIAVVDTGVEETGKAPTSPSDPNNLSKKIEEDQLNSTRAEVGEAKEENQRLKKVLTRIVKDYQTLQMHFFDIVQQEGTKPPAELISSSKANEPIDVEEPELVSLRLGMSATDMYKKEEKVASKEVEEGLTLGLDSKFESSEEEPGEPWPPSKIAKSSRSGDEEVLPQAQVKRARVSVRARCDTPTMNDGCQWRKYGQKVSKGNPCPRAYYRCTVAPLCPVRKQVQRCADDMSILITTYEGTHNHSLPVTATAMASTTSAAACMLTSGSSTTNRLSASSSISYSNNFATADHSHLISPPNSQPTITLDLTNRYPSHVQQRYAPVTTSTPTSFSFSNQDYRTNLYSGLNQSYWQRAAATSALPPPPPMLGTDTIARAITADPSFQSALAAAITSYVGGRGEGTGGYLARTGSLGSGRQQVVVSDTKSVSGSPVDEMERAK